MKEFNENVYKQLNVLPIKKMYLKVTAIRLKDHNLLQPILQSTQDTQNIIFS